MIRFCRFLLAVLALAWLAACGPAEQPQPTPTSAPLLLAPRPTTPPSEPAPTVAAPEMPLPGRLLFVKDGDIWLWQETAGQKLTHQGNLRQPAWSPNGEWIAAVQRAESYSDIVVLTANGTDPLQLTQNGSQQPLHSYERIYDTIWAFYPSFSPDSSEVAFSGQAGPPFGSPAVDYNLTLFTSPVASGRQQTQLYADAEGQVGRTVYTPDGTAIVFVFSPLSPQGAEQLLRYDLETGAAEPLSQVPAQSYDPTFSPDGRWLAFASRVDNRTDIFARPAVGGTPVRLTNLGSARAPAFSPDGSLLAFLAVAPGSHLFDLWVAEVTPEADGLRVGEPRHLTEGLGIDADSGLAWGR